MQQAVENNPPRKPDSNNTRRRRLGASPLFGSNGSDGNSNGPLASVRPSLTSSSSNNNVNSSSSYDYYCRNNNNNNKWIDQQHQRKFFLLLSLLCCVPTIFVYNGILTPASTIPTSGSAITKSTFLFLFVRRRSLSSDQIPLLIPRNDDDGNHYFDGGNNGRRRDLGGWFIGSKKFHKPSTRLENDGLNDYGGLIFLPLGDNNQDDDVDPTAKTKKATKTKTSTKKKKKKEFRRTIRENDYELYNDEMKTLIHQMDAEHISKRHWFDDELEDYNPSNGCRRQSWEKLHYPNCNSFHEIDLSRHYDKELAKRIGDEQAGDSKYLSHGYFRDVFSLEQPALNNNNHHDDRVRRAAGSGRSSKAVLKVARYTKHEMNYRPLYNAKRDALIMERLSASPNIVDIFGHCGASVVVESLPHEVEEIIVPGGGWIKQKDLHDSRDVDIQNHYTVAEKLDIALAMAQSISELHGFRDGVIVHDDIQLCQWLRNDEGKLKLGDFNRARVLAWNDKKQQYCKYDNGRSYGNYRSPEEYGEKPLSQQHDVWSFGNNIYALLTGLWIFYENEDDEVVADKVMNGTRPFIDPRYRRRSFIEGRLVEIMEKCWVYDLDKRPDIFEILKLLQQLKKDSDARDKRS